MPRTTLTYLICLDDHRSFTEDVKKRFSDKSKYEIISFSSGQEFLNSFRKERDSGSTTVAIIGVPDNKEQFETTGNITQEIRKLNPGAGIILLVPPDKMDDLKKTVIYNIDAYIPRNGNSVLRIHNTVKKLVSEHNISIFRKKRNFALYILLAFFILSAVLLIVSYLRFPKYF